MIDADILPTSQTMLTEEIRKKLFALRDEKYRDFQSKLIPNIAPDTVIGVRTPALRTYAKEISARENVAEFLADVPHRYFDENQLHAFCICRLNDFDRCMEEVERFLPFVDNWATCDQLSPKVFKKNRSALLLHIQKWLASGKTYTVRFAIGMLMAHFLDEDFDRSYLQTVSQIRSDEYYVNMMIAWYFATALAKQYDAALAFIENRALSPWTHNKAIQKSVESYRITAEQKAYLKTLKVKQAERPKEKITLCGDDCLTCPRYTARTEPELKRAAELWHKVGWRDTVVPPEEMCCGGCSQEKNCTYGLISCAEKHGVEKCRQCKEFPCEKINDMLNRSSAFQKKCREVCSPEEYQILKKSFFNKEANLKK